MDPKELKQKLLEQQETRQLLAAASWRRELGGKLRKWTDFSSLGGEREMMELSQKTKTLRIYRKMQNNTYTYPILPCFRNRYPQCGVLRLDVPEGVFFFFPV